MAHKLIYDLTLLGTCALLGLSACGSEAPAPGGAAPGQGPHADGSPGSASEERAGSIELSLKVGNQQLDTMNYAIVGSGFANAGKLDVSHSSKVSGIVGGIPFGNNYALTMNGKGVAEHPLACSGATSFDLNDVGPVPVTIQITCKEPEITEPPPPTGPTPAPVPPFAVLTLACLLAALGVAVQRRHAKS